jgi:hypothetical protein
VAEILNIKLEEIFPEMISEKYNSLQYFFYFGNKRLPYRARTKILNKINKLWDHIEGIHSDEFTIYKIDKKACIICEIRNVIFFSKSVLHFKNYIRLLYTIRFRA